MLAYAVAAARNTGLFDRVVVSSDDELILEVARWYGAEPLRRPAELAGDEVGSYSVTAHALASLGGGEPFRAVCQLLPNCPLRRSGDVSEQYEAFVSGRRQSQVSVVPYRGTYPQWALRQTGEGLGTWLSGPHPVAPSQTLGEPVCPTGALWWAAAEGFLTRGSFYAPPFHLALMDANRGLDIDRVDELELADLIVRGLRDRDGVWPLEPIASDPFPAHRLPAPLLKGVAHG
jgi:CMP-N-acetylneuraminic acid synthetase